MALAAIVLFWGFTGAAAGQTPAPECAAKESAFLQALVGTWAVDAEFRSGDSWESAPGRASIRADLGGCVVVVHYEGTRFEKPYSFLAILGANGPDAAKPMQEVFVHSQHGIVSLSTGRIENGQLALDDAPSVGGRTVLIRHVYFDAGPDGFRYESRRSTDRGASWTVTSRARYRRPG